MQETVKRVILESIQEPAVSVVVGIDDSARFGRLIVTVNAGEDGEPVVVAHCTSTEGMKLASLFRHMAVRSAMTSSPMGVWLSENYEITGSPAFASAAKELYADWEKWRQEAGSDYVSVQWWSREMKRLGIKKTRRQKGNFYLVAPSTGAREKSIEQEQALVNLSDSVLEDNDSDEIPF
jgi:hypothetical protein